MEYIASLSYGKDSMYMLEVIHEHGLPLDKIVTVDVWATPTIPAELPPVVEFKKYADEQIKKRYGFVVEHLRAKRSFEEQFYTVKKCGKRKGSIYGFPFQKLAWCNDRLKTSVLKQFKAKRYKQYIGYAIDEKQPKRQQKIKQYLNGKIFENQYYPLVDFEITEQQAYCWCQQNGLLSPTYKNGNLRGGCWFCQNQRESELRNLRKQYPEYWNILLKWDKDSPYPFKVGGTTVQDLEEKFDMEDRQERLF